jgi:hypothetical protein
MTAFIAETDYVLDQSNEPRTIEVRDDFVIVVLSLASCGYLWSSELDHPETIELTQEVRLRDPPDDAVPGTSYEVFRLRRLQAGPAQMTLSMRRPWLKPGEETDADRTVVFTIAA